jgi:predicted transcriptional regulator
MKKVHIGNVIREKVESSSLSIADFASMINRTRPTVYDIFERSSIDIDLLLRISEVLHYNFLKEVYLKEDGVDKERNDYTIRNDYHYIIGVEVNEFELNKFIKTHNISYISKIISIRDV